MLKGHCRTCSLPISWLYPFIELITTISLALLWIMTPNEYFFPYALFFSSLIITVRTDLEMMLISPLATLALVPIGILFAFFNILPLDGYNALLGSLIGYGLLYSISKLFYWVTKKEGIGAGDFDLLALIGAFTGVIGVWVTLLLSSVIGSIVGIIFLVCTEKDSNAPIPFAPFLALGGAFYVIIQPFIVHLIGL